MKSRKRLEQHYADLDQWTDEAKAGASDAWLAERAETSMSIVSKWRQERGLQRALVQQDQLQALQNLAATYDPSMHAVGSVFDGKWNPPEYLIRHPLNYTVLCRIVHHATHDIGLEPSVVAEGLGLREQDVQRAASAWIAHLRRRGRKCEGCNTIVDPKNGLYCTKRCENANLQEHDNPR